MVHSSVNFYLPLNWCSLAYVTALSPVHLAMNVDKEVHLDERGKPMHMPRVEAIRDSNSNSSGTVASHHSYLHQPKTRNVIPIQHQALTTYPVVHVARSSCNNNTIFQDCHPNCYLIETFLMPPRPNIYPTDTTCVNKCLYAYAIHIWS